MGSSDFVVKLDRIVGNLRTRSRWLVFAVRAVLWEWALGPVEFDANYKWMVSEYPKIHLSLILISFHWNSRAHFVWYIYSFKSVKVGFMAQNVVCIGECPMWTWEECLWCCCWMRYFINVSLVQFMYFAMQILPDFLPASRELNSLACNSGFTCFFLQF